VTSADVAEFLLSKGFEIDKRKIQLHDPLKQLGEFLVPIKLHANVVAQVKVLVTPLQE
jgi:large subunit ribosomal protein L9